jgi:hypothetical protein
VNPLFDVTVPPLLAVVWVIDVAGVVVTTGVRVPVVADAWNW